MKKQESVKLMWWNNKYILIFFQLCRVYTLTNNIEHCIDEWIQLIFILLMLGERIYWGVYFGTEINVLLEFIWYFASEKDKLTNLRLLGVVLYSDMNCRRFGHLMTILYQGFQVLVSALNLNIPSASSFNSLSLLQFFFHKP